MNHLYKEDDGGLGFSAQSGDPEPDSKGINVDVDDENIKENQAAGQWETMNQLQKEEGVSGFNAQGGDREPEPKKIKFDIEDPNVQDTRKNQVEDGNQELSISEFLVKYRSPKPERTIEEEWRQIYDKELLKRGVNVEDMRVKWKDCKEVCSWCGIDCHPDDDCPYKEFIYCNTF